jgi:plastocyanin
VAQTLQIDGVTYLDHGTRDVSARVRRRVMQFDAYFEPTFLRAEPGKQFTLRIENRGREAHNFSIPSLGIDRDVPPGSPLVDIPVTFPADGALRFFCKLHADQGMNGQLQVGPAAPSASPVVPSPSPTPLS